VAVAIALAAMVCYFVVRDQLRGQIDDELRAQGVRVAQGDFNALRPDTFPAIPASAGGPAPYVQVVAVGGRIVNNLNGVALPVDAVTRSVAAGGSNGVLEDMTMAGTPLRVITYHAIGVVDGGLVPVAVQIARPLGPTDHVLANLRLILFVVLLLGMALAATLGRVASRRVLAPLAEVTETARVIGETDDLSRRLAVHADDEVGQLAMRFNEMLERLAHSRAELDDSVQAQRQLVADASHELRTPVTSLRTNIEVLLAGGRLDEEDRRRLLTDVVEQSEELSTLVSDLIDLARGDLPRSDTEEVRLDRVVDESVARARRNSPEVTFTEQLVPVVVVGVEERLHRAVNNLLDNAARHNSPGGPVEVTVDPDGIRVRDHGDGIAEEDLPYLFDRFYRGANSRGRQGSGLGLAIVRQVANQHGGTVTAANAPGGGALFTLKLPTVAADGRDDDAGPILGDSALRPRIPLAGN
jgi:two-component system sensor histidine kinase MprB